MGLQTTAAYFNLDSVGAAFQHPVELDRNVLMGAYGRNRSGRLRPDDFAVTPTGVNQQVSLSSGRAFLLGKETAQQGGYFAWSDAAVTATLAAPSANPRIDTILLRVYDNQYGTITGNPRAQIDIIQGTPGASPSVTADSAFNTGGGSWVPGAWYRLADIRVNPGDTVVPSGQIYTNTTFVQTPGGMFYANSVNNTTGFGGPPGINVNAGEHLFELDTGRHRIRSAALATWLPSGLQAYISTTSAGTSSSGTTVTRDAVLGNLVFSVPGEWATNLLYEVGAYFSGGGDTSGDWDQFSIRDGGASTPTGTSTLLASGDLHPKIGNPTSSQEMITITAIVTGLSAGTHTLGLFSARLTGSGVCTPNPPNGQARYMWVRCLSF